MKYIQKGILAISVLLLLSSCGVIDLAYNNAPSYVAGEFEDAFGLNQAQSDQLDARLQQFFAWHRRQELTHYRQLLDQAALSAADGISADEFLALHDDVRAAWRRSLEKAIDSLGDLAATLTPQQIEQYQNYHRENSEEHQEYLELTPQQREIRRVNRNFDRLESWFGDFDYDLEKRIATRLQRLPDIDDPWFRYREARHRALIEALRRAPDTGITPQQLKSILLDPSTDFARAFEPERRAYWRAFAVALEDISSWVSDRHRHRLAAKLQNYARAAERLSSQG